MVRWSGYGAVRTRTRDSRSLLDKLDKVTQGQLARGQGSRSAQHRIHYVPVAAETAETGKNQEKQVLIL